MPSPAQARILSWVNQTPNGPSHVALVLIDRGLFIADRLNAELMAKLKSAVATDTTTVIAFLSQLEHGRRPAFVPWGQIDEIRSNLGGDAIEVAGADGVATVDLADRERQEKITAVLSAVCQTRNR